MDDIRIVIAAQLFALGILPAWYRVALCRSDLGWVDVGGIPTYREGPWRYARHPNYFSEWLGWFSYVILFVGAAYGGWAWLGPGVMLVWLLRVTGMTFAEPQSLRRRGNDDQDDQQTTHMFIPRFPRYRSPS